MDHILAEISHINPTLILSALALLMMLIYRLCDDGIYRGDTNMSTQEQALFTTLHQYELVKGLSSAYWQ